MVIIIITIIFKKNSHGIKKKGNKGDGGVRQKLCIPFGISQRQGKEELNATLYPCYLFCVANQKHQRTDGKPDVCQLHSSYIPLPRD